MGVFVDWLIQGAVGPSLIALPVNWTATQMAGVAQRWFRRLSRTDDLGRLVRAATGASADLTRVEFGAVRRLLEDQQTWTLIGQGSVEDLAAQIASSLPARDGRTAEESRAAARAITRGLLEFAVADLEPKVFQQVLLARLQRMETNQASSLDEAMLGLHADLMVGLTSVTEQLKRVLNRLPPGAADRGEIAIYLQTLINWVSTDPWPRDQRFGGPMLTPAAIERKLRVLVASQRREQHLDADQLTEQCQRLVILGGPGSGKTWLAKRTARRCAQKALNDLAAGRHLDEVELPLLTTCARLVSVAGDIREAAVSSALDQLADLGGSRIGAALRAFFTERNAPTVLLIDSLDEAHGSDERLRQADTLPWRIVLTSRPNSWSLQLVIDDGNDSHRVGELEALRYPDDVEPFIERWFAPRPKWGNDLVRQISQRHGLQQAATVPLILAFYCIVGGDQPLPDFRRDLYAAVLNRMLTGRWRGSDDSGADADVCMPVLRDWAWSAAASHSTSGIASWADDFSTEPGRLGNTAQRRLDHVAVRIGPPDVDTGKSSRRFIHRSIREHLVAEHVASRSVQQATEILLPHLWYDADWEYAAPTAVAMHPCHDQLLRSLICRAANSDQIPEDLSSIDSGGEILRFLARIAAESNDADWSPEVAEIISRARVELARSACFDDLSGATSWGTSNRHVRDALLGLLSYQTSGGSAAGLVGVLVNLNPTLQDKLLARDALLRLLSRKTDGSTAAMLVSALVRLDPTAQDRRLAREALLRLLARATETWEAGWMVAKMVQLAPEADDKRQTRDLLLSLLTRQSSSSVAAQLVGGVLQLNPTAKIKRQACQVLLGQIASEAGRWEAEELADALVQLEPTADDKRQARRTLLALLTDETSHRVAEKLAGGLVQLEPTADDKRQARRRLLALLATEAEGWQTDDVVRRAEAQIGPTPEDKRRARYMLLVVDRLIQLDATASDKRQARGALLEILTRRPGGWTVAELVNRLVQLDPTAGEGRRARDTLLTRLILLSNLPGHALGRPAERLMVDLVKLAPKELGLAHIAWLRLQAGQTGKSAADLVSGLIQLTPTATDRRRARDALLWLLTRPTASPAATDLMSRLLQLDPTPSDKRQARSTLLGLLTLPSAGWATDRLVSGLMQLDTTAEDKRQARSTLLGQLARSTPIWLADRLASCLVQLDPTAEDKRQARSALLWALADQSDSAVTTKLLSHVIQLAPAAEDKRQVRRTLLWLLAGRTHGPPAERLVSGLAEFEPTVHDLSTWRTWSASPTVELLAAVRGSVALDIWLAALPTLPSLSP